MVFWKLNPKSSSTNICVLKDYHLSRSLSLRSGNLSVLSDTSTKIFIQFTSMLYTFMCKPTAKISTFSLHTARAER